MLVLIALSPHLRDQTIALPGDQGHQKANHQKANQSDRIAEDPDLKSLRLRSEEDILQKRTPHSQGDGDRRPIDQRAECDGQYVEIAERNIRYDDPVGVGNGSHRQEDDKVEHSGDAGFFYLDTLLFLVALLLALHTYYFSRDYGLL